MINNEPANKIVKQLVFEIPICTGVREVMAFKFECSVFHSGTNTVMTIPHTILENYPIKKGQKLKVLATENGLFISIKQIGTKSK